MCYMGPVTTILFKPIGLATPHINLTVIISVIYRLCLYWPCINLLHAHLSLGFHVSSKPASLESISPNRKPLFIHQPISLHIIHSSFTLSSSTHLTHLFNTHYTFKHLTHLFNTHYTYKNFTHLLNTPSTPLQHTLHTSTTHLTHLLNTYYIPLQHTLHTSSTHLPHLINTSYTPLQHTLHTSSTHHTHLLNT